MSVEGNAHEPGPSSFDAPTEHRGLIAWWAQNGVAANLLMLLAIIGGIIGYIQMDRLTFPTAGWNGVTVSVSWPGASPAEVEEQILVRIEEAIADMEGIEAITSRANEGSGSVSIEALRSTDMEPFINDLKLRVDAINNLPAQALRPVVRRWMNDNWYMGMALHGNVDRLELKRLADDIRDEVARQVPGASRAIVNAALDEEVSIEVSDEALRRFGLTFEEVANAIRSESVNVGGGFVRTQSGNVSVATRNQANNAEEFENIIVRQTEDGALVRVRDVATVRDGFVDANFDATFNGEPMTIIALRTLEQGMNVVNTKRELADFIEAKQAELPPGVNLTLWWDDSDAYFARMKTVLNSAGIGLILVLATLMLFLRPIVAFWVAIGIATAFLGAIAVLPYLGVSLNMLSLFAFLLVIGIVVDDAIIVGENIHNQVERGRRGHDAAIWGTRLVAKPVIFAIITTVLAFLPWILLSGPEVQFTGQISLVVMAALGFSLVESLLILPNHLAHLKPQRTTGFFGPLIRFQKRFADGLIWVANNLYRPLIATAIRTRYATVTLFISFMVLSIGALAMGYVKTSFMPDVEQDFIFVQIDMPDGTPYSRVLQIKEQLEVAEQAFMDEMNARYPEKPIVDAISAFSFDDGINAWISLHPAEDRPKDISVAEISEDLRERLGPVPDAEEVNFTSNFNNNQSRVFVSLQSDNLEALVAAATDLKAQLSTYDATFDVRDSMQSAADEARLSLLAGAQALGLTEAEVTRQLANAFYGVEAQRLPRDGQDVRVMVRLTKSERESLESLEQFRIRTDDGREVPLAAVAEVSFADGINRILRRDRQREVYVVADVKREELGQVYQDLEQNYYQFFDARHPQVNRVDVGERQDQNEFNQEVSVLFLIVLVGMYFLLAIAFRAIFQPLLILISIPFCLVGAVIGNLIMGVSLGLFSVFGIIAAAGVVINDNLVLIDYVNRLRREGMGAFQALVEAGTARFRPILLTSVTTFIGVLPMMMERSTQAQFLKPMVVALAFAIVFALFLTLFLVPALYALGSDIGRYFKWLWNGERFHLIGANEIEEKRSGGSAAPQPAE